MSTDKLTEALQPFIDGAAQGFLINTQAPNYKQVFRNFCKDLISQALALSSPTPSDEREAFDVDPKALEFALWKGIDYGQKPRDHEACRIRFKDGEEYGATFYEEANCFGVGEDGEVALHEVRWMSAYPESIIEQAARNWQARGQSRQVAGVDDGMLECIRRMDGLLSECLAKLEIQYAVSLSSDIEQARTLAAKFLKRGEG